MKGMVKVITPLAVETDSVLIFRKNCPAVILMGLTDQVNRSSPFFRKSDDKALKHLSEKEPGTGR